MRPPVIAPLLVVEVAMIGSDAVGSPASVAELIARFLFYDVRHATIAGTDDDHRVVVLDKEVMRLRLRHFLHDLRRQRLQFYVLRHDVTDSVRPRTDVRSRFALSGGALRIVKVVVAGDC